jgi:hypothetical protein
MGSQRQNAQCVGQGGDGTVPLMVFRDNNNNLMAVW